MKVLLHHNWRRRPYSLLSAWLLLSLGAAQAAAQAVSHFRSKAQALMRRNSA